jgi:hypothetical protein
MIQATNKILMVKPTHFYKNTEAQDNLFYVNREPSQPFAKCWDNLYNALSSKGISISAHFDKSKWRPDAIFPNNWFSTHTGGEICLYPMALKSRQNESELIFPILESNYPILYDMTKHIYGDNPKYLEGTGSMVLDRKNQIAYAGKSKRTDKELFLEWCKIMKYRPVYFETLKENPIYHTNVMMSIGQNYSVVCSEVIDKNDRDRVISNLKQTHNVIDISREQMNDFCGNIIELRKADGGGTVVMSDRAYGAFSSKQLDELKALVGDLTTADIGTIEDLGGGGVRCMIAELF